jgi:hypothetical protein
VSDRLEEIPACAVHLGERDEGATQIVAPARAKAELGEILAERVLSLLLRAPGEVSSGHDEIL